MSEPIATPAPAISGERLRNMLARHETKAREPFNPCDHLHQLNHEYSRDHVAALRELLSLRQSCAPKVESVDVPVSWSRETKRILELEHSLDAARRMVAARDIEIAQLEDDLQASQSDCYRANRLTKAEPSATEHFPATDQPTRCCYKYGDGERCTKLRTTHSFCDNHAKEVRRLSSAEPSVGVERDQCVAWLRNAMHGAESDVVISLYEAQTILARLTRVDSDADALGNHAFAYSANEVSGYRLTIGFDTLKQMQAAHQAVVNFGKALKARMAGTGKETQR